MTKEPISIQLYDADITDRLNGWPEDIVLPRTTPDHLGVFENLQEQELIHAIYQYNYSKAYRLLRRLDHILSLADAIAACLCALACTPKLMETLLDHCPPIRSFQFLGVGNAASLLSVAARHDKNQMLDILLRRGADPNGGPTTLTAVSPVEAAFCAGAHLALKRLLEEPSVKVELTENILSAWGHMDPKGGDFPLTTWNCQLLMNHLTGVPTDPFAPPPIPPQLRLGHALHRANPELALRICETRPLTEADFSDIEEHFTRNNKPNLLRTSSHERLLQLQQTYTKLLVSALEQFPARLNTPLMRFAVASTALSMPQADASIQHWVEQLEDGPIEFSDLPLNSHSPMAIFAAHPWWQSVSVEDDFFHRWDERLGSRLVPTMDANAPVLSDLMPDSIQRVVERIRFTGIPNPAALSNISVQALLYAPEELLPSLLQPGGLLTKENPSLLLDACQELPAARRNCILPLIQKEAMYFL